MGKHARLAVMALISVLINFPYASAQLLPQVSSPPGKPAAPKAAQIVVQTSPNAQVYLDDVFRGQASPKGRLVINDPKPGDHVLRVTLPRKKNFEQTVTVTAGQVAEVAAVLTDPGGTVIVRTSPGAAVFIDDAARGLVDATGQLTIPDVAPGAHQLRVVLVGEEDFLQHITVTPGQEAHVVAALVDAGVTVNVETSPGATVFLDGNSRGTADAAGHLAIPSVAPGSHALRITAPGKQEFKKSLSVSAGQPARIMASLADLGVRVIIRTSPGATVFLDDSSRGSADASGQMTIPEVAAGSHDLRITAANKQEYRQSITVSAGKDFKLDAPLVDLEPTTGTARTNPRDGLPYVWIPPGNFEMGCSPGDNECSPLEQPTHRLTISRGFWLGQTEVTVGAYKRFVEATFRKMPATPSFNPGWANDSMPIVQVNWENADNYCRWAGGRLLTEAEWEYAARAGTTDARYGPIEDVAWFNGNSSSQTHPVAQKRANGFGLFDMLGNAAEWVNDHYSETFYGVSPSQDPQGPTAGKDRVIRGRGWDDIERTVRASQREYADPTGRFSDVGFRCGGDIFAPSSTAHSGSQ